MITGNQVGPAAVATPAQIAEANKRSIAVAFINKADKTRYGQLVEDLRNNYLMGQDNYLKTLNRLAARSA
jgi:hypothetical protein